MNIKKEILTEFRKKFTDKWSNGIAVVYPVKEGVSNIIPAEDLESFLSLALTRVEEAERKMHTLRLQVILANLVAHEKNCSNSLEYLRNEIPEWIASLSASKEKEFGYMGKVTNAGNIASSEKDSVCNCDGTVHRKSSHSPKKEKREV